jgi:hypothetical protein
MRAPHRRVSDHQWRRHVGSGQHRIADLGRDDYARDQLGYLRRDLDNLRRDTEWIVLHDERRRQLDAGEFWDKF